MKVCLASALRARSRPEAPTACDELMSSSASDDGGVRHSARTVTCWGSCVEQLLWALSSLYMTLGEWGQGQRQRGRRVQYTAETTDAPQLASVCLGSRARDARAFTGLFPLSLRLAEDIYRPRTAGCSFVSASAKLGVNERADRQGRVKQDVSWAASGSQQGERDSGRDGRTASQDR